MPENHNPWRELPSKPPYVLSSDATLINKYNSNAKDDFRIQLDALPEPFFGNKNAPIVLLGLNPGFDDKDPEVHSNADFQYLLRNNYLHMPSEYPFYYLNPNFHNQGRVWWGKILKPLLSIFSCEKLGESLFCVEYFPYHSRHFNHTKLILLSQEYGFSIVRNAMERKAVIVMMRARKLWLEKMPGLKSYPSLMALNNPQNVVISSRNCSGFDKIVLAIKDYDGRKIN